MRPIGYDFPTASDNPLAQAAREWRLALELGSPQQSGILEVQGRYASLCLTRVGQTNQLRFSVVEIALLDTQTGYRRVPNDLAAWLARTFCGSACKELESPDGILREFSGRLNTHAAMTFPRPHSN
jgi:hypothetical protein